MSSPSQLLPFSFDHPAPEQDLFEWLTVRDAKLRALGMRTLNDTAPDDMDLPDQHG